MYRRFLWFLLLLTVAGCGRHSLSLSLQPSPNQDRAELTASDVVAIMKRAGFADEEILEFGGSLCNALATHGACQISIGQFTDTIIAVNEGTVYIVSHGRGSATYDLKSQSFK